MPQSEEELDMHRLDGGDHRHLRADHVGQGQDLVRMVHADLEHAEDGLARHAGEGERNAPMIVVGSDRGIVVPWRESARRIASLVPVLPTEPVIATIFAFVRAPARPVDAHGLEHVRHDDELVRAFEGRSFSSDTAGDAPLSKAAAPKSWPSCTSPLMAK